MHQLKKYLVEFTGTYLLVLVGAGVCVLNELYQSPNHLGVSASFGIIVFLMILLFAKTSGAHINPAVSIAFWKFKKISAQECLVYILAQCLGAIAAAGTLLAIFPESNGLGGTYPSLNNSATFIWEFVLSFVLMYGILFISERTKSITYVALVVGAIVGLDAYIGGPFTGASMNPARSIGPALVAGNLSGLWIYILSPILACLSAEIIYKKLPFK